MQCFKDTETQTQLKQLLSEGFSYDFLLYSYYI